MSEKLCVFCRHFRFSQGIKRGGSEYTGEWVEGDGCSCELKHLPEDGMPYGENELRNILLTAETCPDYERPQS